jgi:site-specific DNA-methyltransferase (adenine-specific)/modification methylase
LVLILAKENTMTNPWTRKEVIGDCTLYLGDCLEVMPALEFDGICTDPPYGIGEGKKASKRTKSAKGDARWKGRTSTDYDEKDWDISTPDINWIFSSPMPAIVWGGNYFEAPKSSQWLVWDKKTDGSDFADCELAWTNGKGAVRRFEWLWSGFRKQVPEKRYHPTQKPVALMEWCLGFLPNAETILDPFMGSGTTLVACAKLGRKGIGIELDPDYFEIACKRVQAAYDQPDLFVAPPTPPTQEGMDL